MSAKLKAAEKIIQKIEAGESVDLDRSLSALIAVIRELQEECSQLRWEICGGFDSQDHRLNEKKTRWGAD